MMGLRKTRCDAVPRAAAIAIACTLLAAPAEAASLRREGILIGPTVRIGDLWDDTGADAARVLGPGPAPGGRIVVGAAQLGAIARAYGVDWQPDSDADSAVLSRPGRVIGAGAVTAALRPALAKLTGGDFDIVLPIFAPPVVDEAASTALGVTDVSLDPASGRFSALVSGADGAVSLRLAGSVVPVIDAVVAARPLAMGTALEAADLTRARVRQEPGAAPLRDFAQAVGFELRHPLAAGRALTAEDLQRPPVVHRHDRVLLTLALPGLDLGAVGEAMQDAGMGESVLVRNPVSGALVSGTVTEAGRVRVDPGSAPVTGPARGGFAVAAR